jgi:hypothetical protein
MNRIIRATAKKDTRLIKNSFISFDEKPSTFYSIRYEVAVISACHFLWGYEDTFGLTKRCQKKIASLSLNGTDEVLLDSKEDI